MFLRKVLVCVCASAMLLAAPGAARAQSQNAPETAITVVRLLSIMAQRTGKTFIVDPRVRGDVTLIDRDPAKVSYADFLALLQANGFAAVESGKVVRVVPAAIVRQLPVPIVSGAETRPDAEYVTRIIPVKNVPAATLVPILRPLLPQEAHFVASACTNVLIVADTFGNVRRIESLVQSLDKGEPYDPGKCTGTSPDTRRRSPAQNP
jgi:general secretion pathway protein D